MLDSWVVWPITLIGLLTVIAAAVWLLHQLIDKCATAMRLRWRSVAEAHRERVLWCAMVEYMQTAAPSYDPTTATEQDKKLWVILSWVKQETTNDT